VIVRGKDLGAKMSDYLVRRIHAQENIEVLTGSNVTAVAGKTYMERVEIHHGENKVDNKILYLFTFIGAKPCTDWIGDSIQTDTKGFIATGHTIESSATAGSEAFESRKPYPFETSSPGFFAVGDVRSGSVKRVASAVGEGSIVVSDIHKYLALEPVNS
jgi:thioredoxin reductase (NADPH)